MTRTIFYRRDDLTGRYQARWQLPNGKDQRMWIAEAFWPEFMRQWGAHGYTFVETEDWGDPQDRR